MNKIAREYKEKGYVIIKGLYTKKKTKKILDKIKSLNVDDYENSKEKDGYPFRITNISKKNPELVALYRNKKIDKILENLLGDKIQYFKDKFVSKKKDGRVFVPHIDGAFQTFNYRLSKETDGWFTYAKKFIHLQILLSKNTKKNGCLNICKMESDNYKYYQKKYFKTKWSKISSEFPKRFHKKFFKTGKPFTGNPGDVLIFNPLCPHFSYTNKTNSRRDTLLVTFNGKSDGDKYYLSNYDKKLVIEKKKAFVDKQ